MAERFDFLREPLFHGSQRNGLTRLDPLFSDHRHPFGQGVYLSALEDTARRYAKAWGTVYRVQLKGRPELTIDLDAPFFGQTIEAREVIKRIAVLEASEYAQRGSRVTARETIGPKHQDTRPKMTAQLLDAGIWMIYGSVCPVYERNGPEDDGVQYVVLDRGYIDLHERIPGELAA